MDFLVKKIKLYRKNSKSYGHNKFQHLAYIYATVHRMEHVLAYIYAIRSERVNEAREKIIA